MLWDAGKLDLKKMRKIKTFLAEKIEVIFYLVITILILIFTK